MTAPGRDLAAGIAAFTKRFPTLFHVTDPEAVPGVRAHGLLSAAALASLFGVPGAERPALLEANRGKGNFHRLSSPTLGTAVLRDQWMPDEHLAPCLRGDYVGRPGAWRRMINDHVFFWLSEAQALKLAKVNAARRQRVLAFDAASLLARHGARAFTTAINAGFALPLYGRPASPRDENTLRPLWDFPRADRRAPRELALRGGVPDATAHEVSFAPPDAPDGKGDGSAAPSRPARP